MHCGYVTSETKCLVSAQPYLHFYYMRVLHYRMVLETLAAAPAPRTSMRSYQLAIIHKGCMLR